MYTKIKAERLSSMVWTVMVLLLLPALCIAEEEDTSVELETGFYYTVKKGDTLWDLSNKFSDSPWVWPELWSENKQLTNPHWIYPGQRLRLYLRKDLEKAELPVQKKPSVPPPAKEKPIYYYPKIDSIGFIKKTPVVPSGEIIKVKDDKVMISENDMIYIRPAADSTLAMGQRYYIYRTFSPLKQKKINYGIQHYITGIAEITKIESDYALATVTRSFRPIHTYDLLMPYKKKTPNITLTESVKNLEGEIIITEERANYFGDNTIAFIDKGAGDGVQEGQMYNVYYQEETRAGKVSKETSLTPITFGSLLVLHCELETATVLITSSERDMHPGTKIHVASGY